MSSFRLRPAGAADAEEVVGLVAALDVALLGQTDYSLAELESEWLDVDPGDRWVVVGDGRIVGYGTVEEGADHGLADGYVLPAAWGRGVGALLVDELERELRTRGAARVQNAVLATDARAHELLGSRGYREIRRFWQMRIHFEHEPAAPTWPGGLTVSSFHLADAEAFHAAYEEAFADHWQHERRPFERWRAAYIEHDDFTPRLWTVVRDGSEIVAGTICRPERLGVAWVARLFTRSAWRRQGLGEALLRDAFGRFWHDGKRSVGLGVDAQSDTGAHRLYERVGMRVHWSAVVFEKEL